MRSYSFKENYINQAVSGILWTDKKTSCNFIKRIVIFKDWTCKTRGNQLHYIQCVQCICLYKIKITLLINLLAVTPPRGLQGHLREGRGVVSNPFHFLFQFKKKWYCKICGNTPLGAIFILKMAFVRLFQVRLCYIGLGDCPSGLEPPAGARNRRKATVKIR